MIKRVIHTAITLAVLLVSCRQDDLPDSMPTAHEGYVALRFSADIPAMQEVVTRSVDPDGGGVQDMTLFRQLRSFYHDRRGQSYPYREWSRLNRKFRGRSA